jgi:hypothetical protein
LNQLTEDQLANIDYRGDVPKGSRLTDVFAAWALWTAAWQADRENAYNRARVQEMIDGFPPYDQSELDNLGQSQRTNLNLLEGAAIIEAALQPYNDLTSSVDYVAQVETAKGDSQTRSEWNQIISEEFDRTLRNWHRFEFNNQALSREFVVHGLGVVYFEDDFDWRWKVCGLSDFILPRNTPANEEDIDYAIARRRYTTTQLYQFIKDEEFAKQNGWNIEETKKAIYWATSSRNSAPTSWEWEELERELKQNDVYFGRVRAKEIWVLHFWVREFDGTISHFLTLENGLNQDFLYRNIGRFKSIRNCVHIFTYGIGNGYYHSVRGLGYKIFPQIQVSNQLRCAVIDATFFSAGAVIQPEDSVAVDELSFSYMGPFTLVPPNIKFVDYKRENISQNILPIVQDLSAQIQNNTGTYQARFPEQQGVQGRERKTKLEIQAQLSKESTLSTSAMNLFYIPWDRVLAEAFRRLTNPALSQLDPGGPEAFEFRQRCLKRKVPEDALKHIKRVRAVRAVGYGSASARLLALDQVGQLAPQFDEIGRRNAIRDRVAAYVGYAQADRYVPSIMSGFAGRQPIDKKFAELENALLMQGQPVPVNPDDIPVTHIVVHLMAIHAVIAGIKQGQIPAMRGSPMLHSLLNHIVAHVQQLTRDPTRFQQVRFINRGLNLVEGFLTQLDHNIAEAQAAIARQGEQAAAAQQLLAQRAQMGELPGGQTAGGPVTGAGGGRNGSIARTAGTAPALPGPAGVAAAGQTTAARYAQHQAAAQGQPPLDPKLIADIQAHQIKMQIMKDEADLKNQISADQGRQKIAFEDARMARRIAREAQLMGMQASRGGMSGPEEAETGEINPPE